MPSILVLCAQQHISMYSNYVVEQEVYYTCICGIDTFVSVQNINRTFYYHHFTAERMIEHSNQRIQNNANTVIDTIDQSHSPWLTSEAPSP